jgi:hypothetical protein
LLTYQTLSDSALLQSRGDRLRFLRILGSGQGSAAADAAMAEAIARLEAGIAALDQVIEDAIAPDWKLGTSTISLGLSRSWSPAILAGVRQKLYLSQCSDFLDQLSDPDRLLPLWYHGNGSIWRVELSV